MIKIDTLVKWRSSLTKTVTVPNNAGVVQSSSRIVGGNDIRNWPGPCESYNIVVCSSRKIEVEFLVNLSSLNVS